VASRFAQAPSAAARTRVLEKFEQPAQLDEAAALRLYETDAALASPFILKHLPWRGWGRSDDMRWQRAMEAARRRGDEAFAFQLYRHGPVRASPPARP
jgi:hypothetical protein